MGGMARFRGPRAAATLTTWQFRTDGGRGPTEWAGGAAQDTPASPVTAPPYHVDTHSASALNLRSDEPT